MTERLTPEAARALTDQIKSTLDDLIRLIISAYEGEADRALGYDRWDIYVRKEFPELPRFNRLERREAVRELLEGGLSGREAAAVLGVDEATVRRDLVDLPAANAAGRSTPRGPTPTIPGADARDRILTALEAGGGTVRQIVQATDLPRETVRNQLRRLQEEGVAGNGDVCEPILAEIIPTPFAWYGDKINEYIAEIHQQHELTEIQAKALGVLADAVDAFVATADDD